MNNTLVCMRWDEPHYLESVIQVKCVVCGCGLQMDAKNSLEVATRKMDPICLKCFIMAAGDEKIEFGGVLIGGRLHTSFGSAIAAADKLIRDEKNEKPA